MGDRTRHPARGDRVEAATPAEGVDIVRRAAAGWRLTCTQRLRRSPAEVFPFFADTRNLERITPPFLGFRIVRVAGEPIARGTRIDYRLRLHRVPVFWRTMIADWNPPHRFVDRQVIGPFRRWHHEHTFAADGGGTVMRDVVTFDLYCRGLAATPLLGWVQPDLRRIFEYRRAQVAALLGPQ